MKIRAERKPVGKAMVGLGDVVLGNEGARETVALLHQLVAEQRRTNELLTELVARGRPRL